MNSKMTTNLQLLITKPKKKTPKQKQTKQTTRTETEPQKWRSHGGLSIGDWEGGKVQRINSINDRWKIDRGRVKIV